MTTYGPNLGIYTPIFSMNLVLLWFIIYVTLHTRVLANVDFYPDVTPEDYVIEQLAKRFLQENQHRPYNSRGTIPEFTYRFPERSSVSEKVSPFAVSPSDPRYYEDSQSLTDNPNIITNLFPRQSKSDEDYDQAELDSSSDLKPESQTQRAPHQAEESTNHVAAYKAPSPEEYNMVPVDTEDKSDLYFIGIVAGCSAAAVVGVIAIGISWYKLCPPHTRLQKNAKAAADVEYPAYGVTGPNKEVSPTGDRRLAQSAQMYHYQHQKQQIIAMESHVTNERNGSVSEAESEEENEEGQYTVYECPGLAPTGGEMEVKNPLFQDDPTPATPVVTSAPAPTTEKTSSSAADAKK